MGLEFGENWLVPVEERLGKKFPLLSKKAKIYLDKHIKEMREYGLKLVYECIDGATSEDEAFSKLEIGYPEILAKLQDKSPKLRPDLLEKLYSQSVYYSRK